MPLIVLILTAFGLGYWLSRSKYHKPIDNAFDQTKNALVRLVRRKPESVKEQVKQSSAE